eukprot:SM000023S07597  [mRNA]  locus=s23:342399:346060:- [translate_table: standard]
MVSAPDSEGGGREELQLRLAPPGELEWAAGPSEPPGRKRAWRGHREAGDFALAADPSLVLHVLGGGSLGSADLARLEATCTYFHRPAHFPPDAALPLPEVAALDMCNRRPCFATMPPQDQDDLRTRCGGSWKRVLAYLAAGEAAYRRGAPQVVAGAGHSLAAASSGAVLSFGAGAHGQLGHGGRENEARPHGHRATHVAAAKSRSMVVTECGAVYMFGKDCYGEAEYAAASPRAVATPTLVESLAGIFVVQVALGNFFTAVLSREGRVYTLSWGAGERLGHHTNVDDRTPHLLGGPLDGCPVVQVAAGYCYLMVLTHDRRVFSLGCGLGGKLGHGTRTDERAPREIAEFRTIGFQPVALAAGAWHAAALGADGRICTWGWGRHGCLGHGLTDYEVVPKVVASLVGVPAVHVSAGDYTTFVLSAEGEVWSFGCNDSTCLGHGEDDGEDLLDAEHGGGEVGDGGGAAGDGGGEEGEDGPDVARPRRMRPIGLLAGERIVQASATKFASYDAHCLLLTQHGRVLACGAGTKGQLGAELAGGATQLASPQPVDGLCLLHGQSQAAGTATSSV